MQQRISAQKLANLINNLLKFKVELRCACIYTSVVLNMSRPLSSDKIYTSELYY